MNYFEKGQAVWDYRFGKGEVITIENPHSHTYPVIVGFEDSNKKYRREAYTLDGKFHVNDANISLSQKPLFPIQNAPILKFKKGELVWVAYNDTSEWCARYFSHIDGEYYYCFNAQKKEGSCVSWAKILPFDQCPLSR